MTTDTPYIEQDCIITHEGQSFEAGGAVVTPDFIIGYLYDDGKVKSWHGETLGTYRITSTWRIYSAWSSSMSQVYARINGIEYTGRSMGVGFSFKGKRVANQ